MVGVPQKWPKEYPLFLMARALPELPLPCSTPANRLEVMKPTLEEPMSESLRDVEDLFLKFSIDVDFKTNGELDMARRQEELVEKLSQKANSICKPIGPQINNSIQDVADEGEKKKLVQENQALRDQIQKMRIAAKNQERSRADERLISGLRKKVIEGRTEFVRQLKRKYEGTVTDLKRKLTTLENKAAKQARNFKAEREHCYALMSQMEEDMQQLQNQNHHDTQVLEARN
uniref:Tropomyosin alpha-1 chain-like n=1 Tax=Nicotiana tabacum TaxID=4097 RepID=A0A1S4DJI7_TOBAC|nr:PREDICTED: tropomyosin alpha-1 chain-like [Nicotiana tabacum]